MSTIVVALGCRFQINSKDHGIPHCHIIGHGGVLKVSLIDFEIIGNTSFSLRDTKRLVEIVKLYQAELLAKWGEYHGEKK